MADAEVPIEEPRPKGELETGAETRTSIADRYTKVRKGVAERALGIRRIFPRFASSQEVTELNEFDAELNTITQETSWQLGSMGEEANTPAQKQESVADRIRRRIMLPPKRKAYIEKSTPQDEDPFFTPEEYATLAQEALVEGRHKKRDPGLVDQLHVVGKDDNKPFDTTSENDTESHQLLHAERQPIAENIISLMTTDGVSSEGILQLGERLKGSHGKALVVVHPYFQEFNVRTSTEDMYKEYLQNLLDEVRDSQEQEIPLVLLECFYNADKMQEILNRIGMTDREVYLVQTEAYSPQPKNGVPLVALASLLHASGLEEAKVIGTLYWEREISGKYKVDRYGGCAGETRERLTDAGVRATVGRAVLAAL